MPWFHCARTLLDDQKTCPSCGAGKDSWTTRLNRTRVLAIGERFQGDGEAQSDVLLVAAASAAPFCEECERSEDEDDGWEDDEVQAPPPSPDAAAQADALASASESGTPFCEECQQAEEEHDDGWDDDEVSA